MCAVSMVMGHYEDKWDPLRRWKEQQTPPFAPFPNQWPTQDVSKDIEQLRKEVQDMKELLKRAIKYDQDNNQADCELEEKKKFLKAVAEAVGLTLDDVFPKEAGDAKQE